MPHISTDGQRRIPRHQARADPLATPHRRRRQMARTSPEDNPARPHEYRSDGPRITVKLANDVDHVPDSRPAKARRFRIFYRRQTASQTRHAVQRQRTPGLSRGPAKHCRFPEGPPEEVHAAVTGGRVTAASISRNTLRPAAAAVPGSRPRVQVIPANRSAGATITMPISVGRRGRSRAGDALSRQ